MRSENDPDRALERMGDELEERKERLDDQLGEARELLADRAAEARHLGEGEEVVGDWEDADESDPARPGNDGWAGSDSIDNERADSSSS
jgi:hypothetical protein